MSFFKSLFGGADKSAQNATIAQNKEGRDFVRQQLAQTRGDIFGNFPLAQDARREGYQSAIDLFGQSAPARINPLIQGNMNAQTSLLAGLPQIRNAILGGHVNMNYTNPQQVSYDTSWMNQTLSDPRRLQQGGQQQPNIAQLLAGLR